MSDAAGPTRCMLDIETLGTEPGAAVIGIGAVLFDANGVSETFERSISTKSCQEAGLAIEADTLEWWLGQDDDAREVLTGGVNLSDTLCAFHSWYRGHDVEEVWANSPAFDCVLLEAAFEAIDLEPPWAFYEQRDVRTVKGLPVAATVENEGVEHDALDDAIHQARVVGETLRRLQEAKDE